MRKIVIHTNFLNVVLALSMLLTSAVISAAETHDLRRDPQMLLQLQNHGNASKANLHATFGLAQNEDLLEIRSHLDANGTTHRRYQQTLGGVPVWAEQVIVSSNSNGEVVRLHVRLIEGLADEIFSVNPALNADEVLEKMKDQVKSDHPAAAKLNFKNQSSQLVI